MVRHFLSPVVTKAVAALVVGCALMVLPARARAQDPAAASGVSNALGQGFGAQGQFVISNEMSAEFTRINHVGWVFGIKPAADYFLVPNISVGAALGVAIGNNDRRGYEAGARAGYNLNVTEHVGAWPIVGISYAKATGPGAFSATYGNLFVPLLYHIVPRVFVGFGPYYNLKIAGTGEHAYGFHSTVAAWF